MSNALADFLIKMGNDVDLQRDYATQPEAVMTRHSLADDDKAALRSGNESSIFARIGNPVGMIIVKQIFVYPKK
jgi:hypothetical protein